MLTHALARRAVSSADFDVWVEKLSSEFFFFFFFFFLRIPPVENLY